MIEGSLPPVLVTGGAGYIGSHAVLALKDRNWPVAVIDDLSAGSRSAVADGVPFYEGDIADLSLLDRIFSEQRIGAIMHFAGSIIVRESVADPLKYYRNNTAKSQALIQASVDAGIAHFLFSSTAATYGISQTSPIGESAPNQPINPYGWSKLMTEQVLADVSSAHAMNHCILRYFNVAGADPQARSGEATSKAMHLVKVAVETALGKRDHISVFGDDFATRDGTGLRDYIHVSDLADAHVLALQELIREPDQSMTMNCGYGHGFTVLEVLDAVDRVAGVTMKRHVEPRRPGDPDSLVADPSLLRTMLPWKPRFDDLDTIITHALAWEKTLGEH